MNPFVLSGYYGSKYFCDRKQETKNLEEAFESRRNTVLVSSRRMGKTGLIKHLFTKLNKQHKQLKTVYFDTLFVTSQKEFFELLTTSIVTANTKKLDKVAATINRFFKQLNPVFSFDPVTGTPEIEFKTNEQAISKHGYTTLLKYLKEEVGEMAVAIDEFQQVDNFPEQQTEAQMRGLAQEAPGVWFLFSGSKPSLLADMFSNPKRPFFQSANLMEIGEIPRGSYCEFIRRKFLVNDVKIDIEQCGFIYDWCYGHTYYVQFVCNKLYGSIENGKTISSTEIEQCLEAVLQEKQVVIHQYKKLLSQFQWKVLCGIAKEGWATKLTGKGFLQKYALGGASSVRAVVESLLEKDLLIEQEEKVRVFDIFLLRYIQAKL